MTIKQKLQNPLALVAQGFVAGAILFWATVPPDSEARQDNPVESTAAPSETQV